MEEISMPTGVIVNSACVLLGGIAGTFIGKSWIKHCVRESHFGNYSRRMSESGGQDRGTCGESGEAGQPSCEKSAGQRSG